MYIEIDEIIIRDFEREDAAALYQIVKEQNTVRFMKDWSEDKTGAESFYDYIDWLQSQKASTDIFENKRYAIALKDSGEMIGMVGAGLEETLNEVELAYFMGEKHQRKGLTAKAVTALTKWCLSNSDVPYLILTVDCANLASCRLAETCGYELYEKRTPIGHIQPNMESDSYFYYRYYRR